MVKGSEGENKEMFSLQSLNDYNGAIKAVKAESFCVSSVWNMLAFLWISIIQKLLIWLQETAEEESGNTGGWEERKKAERNVFGFWFAGLSVFANKHF